MMYKHFVATAALCALAFMPYSWADNNGQDQDEKPDGKGDHVKNPLPQFAKGVANGKPGTNGIIYHGGPVMLGTTNVYYIWYGNWSGNSATTILPDLAKNIGGSSYFNINTTYYNGSNVHVSNSVSFAASTTDNYSQGTALSDAGVQAVVSSAITSGRLPRDTSGVYFVLTSADVNETSGFCTHYCGWHTQGIIAGLDVKYAFIGNPESLSVRLCRPDHWS